MVNLVQGVGVYIKGKYRSTRQAKKTREYTVWEKMLERCYSKSFQEKRPTYLGCTVSENFKDFQFFADWCNKQIGFGNNDWQLDKDIIIRGNKLYGEENCVFVPMEINCLLLSSKVNRGNCPIGVHFDKQAGKYRPSVSIGKKTIHLGSYDCIVSAFMAYKMAKEEHIRAVACKYRFSIDDRVYNTLLKWEVNIDD